MVLQQLQDLLAGIYDLPMQHRVYDFLFTERERLPQTLRESNTDEQLLVLDEGGAAAVGLFLDPQLLERLALANRSRRCTPAIWPTIGPRSKVSVTSSIWPGMPGTTAACRCWSWSCRR